jgi:preprotein translocase subunit SecA
MAQPSALAMAAAAAGPAEAGYAGESNGEGGQILPPPVEQRRVDETEQIGRNDPCWCGSGKKFKKCHGA